MRWGRKQNDKSTNSRSLNTQRHIKLLYRHCWWKKIIKHLLKELILYTLLVHTITIRYMTHIYMYIYNLDFKFKFKLVIIYLIVIVYILLMYTILILIKWGQSMDKMNWVNLLCAVSERFKYMSYMQNLVFITN